MNDLILHPTTEKQLANYLNKPSHAITLVAPPGMGKHSIALLLASKLLKIDNARLFNYPYYKLVSSLDSKAIGVDSIRDLEHFLSLKVPNRSSIQRVIVIEDAQMLTIEAQNAFLKTLEEPPIGTVFILSSTQGHALLPTIRSRSPNLIITKPDYNSLKAYFESNGHGQVEVKQALLVSGGLPGLASAILTPNNEHPLIPATELSRTILALSKYNRLLHIDTLVKDKQLALNTLFILQRMAHISLLTASSTSAKEWLRILKYSYNAEVSLLSNGQAKLVLTNLMLHL